MIITGTLIKNGIAVLENGEAKLDILINNGKIAEMAPEIDVYGHEVYSAEGCFVFPGFIDAHTHLDMDTGTALTADDFKSGTLAALCGGTTSIIDFATQENRCTLKEAFNTWYDKARDKCSCNYGFHLAITHVNSEILNEIENMFELGVSSFKVYMAYDALRLSDRDIYDVLLRVKRGGGIVGAHCENGDLVNALTSKMCGEGKLSTIYHPLSRPPYIEAEAVTRFCAIGKAADSPVHIVHVSSKEALDAVRAARNEGMTVMAETCPQYFTLYDDKYAKENFEGAKFVCSPPLRSAEDGLEIWKAVIDEEIGTVSTDHCSFNFKGQKEQGVSDFSKIPNGMPGIEHRPLLVLSKFVEQGLPMHKASNALSSGAAKLFGLGKTKGSLKKGKDADITIYDPIGETLISAASMHQRVDYTPYEGIIARGKIKAVFLNGRLCAENGEPIIENQGKFLKRGRCEL